VISQMNLRGVRSADGVPELLGLLGYDPKLVAELRRRPRASGAARCAW